MKRVYALLVLPIALVAAAAQVGGASAGVLPSLGVAVSMNRYQLSALMFSLALAGVYAMSRARAK
jgi:hypothetical protein